MPSSPKFSGVLYLMRNTNRESKVELPFNRYIYTLLSTTGRIALTVITSVIVPNTLGPKVMGTIAFGQVIVQNLRGLFDFNISSTFFNLSAAKHQSGGLTRLLAKIILFQVVISVIILFLLCFTKAGNNVVQGTSFLILLLLLFIEWALYLTNLTNQLGDTKGISKWSQILILISNLIMTSVLVALAILKTLTVYSFLITTLIFGFLNFFSIAAYLYKIHYETIWVKVGQENLKNFLKSVFKISVPLTIASYYGMGIEFFERFLIQYEYGPEEQSYYYIALKWTGIVIILMSSSLQIFWQSLVKKFAEGDLKAAGDIYRRLDGLLFYIIVTFALIWSFVGKEMISVLLGKDFSNAGKILVVMAFYPIAQVFGQIGTTFAIASGRSKDIMLTNLISSTVGLVISYFLLIPKSAFIPGLGLGGFGLAIKTAIFGFISVQPITFLNCRYLSISYSKIMLQKVKIFLFLFAILMVLTLIGNFFLAVVPVLFLSIVKAIFFALAAAALLFMKPAFCGVNKNDLEKLKNNSLIKRVSNLFIK